MALASQRDVAQEESTAKSDALEEALTVLLRNLAEHCGVARNTDRASVYDFHDERFIMLARWSIHPDYARPGRGEYPTGQGAVGEAWDHTSAVIVLPDTRGRWEQRLISQHGFHATEASGLLMHCQSIAALRLEANHHAVEVLVFESLDPLGSTQDRLDVATGSKLFATLRELVGAVASMTPRVEEVATAAAKAPPPVWKPV